MNVSIKLGKLDGRIVLVCSDVGLTLERSAIHQTSPVVNITYQPLLTKLLTAYWPTQKKNNFLKTNLL